MRPLAAIVLALCAAAPALAQEAKPGGVERARSLVQTLGKHDDDAARRDLYTIGAPALGPLADALAEEQEPAAWSRLAETFEGILRARLQELETRLARLARERAEALAKPPTATAQPAPPAPVAPEKELADAVAALDREVSQAGYAAASELAREAPARDEISIRARELLFQSIARKLANEVVTGDDAARDATATKLARLGPLAAPLVALLMRVDEPRAKEVASAARDRATARYTKLISAADEDSRDFAAESLYGLGELARPALEKVAEDGTPDERHRAERLLTRISWSISDDLYRRTGTLLEGFADLPWRERRMIAYELEKQGGTEAVPALRRILERDPSDGVKVVAAESLARLGDNFGLAFLARIGEKPLVQSPELLAAIAMDQGIRYLQIRRFEKAIAEFNRVLDVQPNNSTALYNLACTFALMGEPDKAFDYLERSIAAGFNDPDYIEKDTDLTSLRGDPRWKKILDQLRLKKRTEGAHEQP